MIGRLIPLILTAGMGYQAIHKAAPLLNVVVEMRTKMEIANIAKLINLDRIGESLPKSDPESFAKYLRDNFKSGNSKLSQDVALDPWGTPYQLFYGKENTFKVASAGADKKNGTNDDIFAGDFE